MGDVVGCMVDFQENNPPRQQKYPWLPIVTENMHEQKDVPSPLTTLDNLKEYQNKTGCVPNTGLETNHTVCSSTHDNVYNPDCFPGNLPYIQQHHPLLPNLRFPLHSTPKSNWRWYVLLFMHVFGDNGKPWIFLLSGCVQTIYIILYFSGYLWCHFL
jgi:hypothetical protein